MDNVSKSSVVKQQISDVYHSKPEEEKECISKKISESHLGRSDEEKTDTIAMRKQTNLERYGVEFYVEYDKFKEEMRERYGYAEITDEILIYYKNVRSLTEKTYKSSKNEIDPNNKRSVEWHVDHIYSIHEGCKNNIAPEVMSHVTNLRIISRVENSSKGARCDKTLEQLYEDVKKASRDAF